MFSFFSAEAYEIDRDTEIYVGGQPIGIKLNNGVSIVGSYGVFCDGKLYKPWEDAGLLEGDKITSLNGMAITDIKSLLKALKTTQGNEVEIKYIRSGKEKTSRIQPVFPKMLIP